jgi:nitrate/TMAO reductase-like tetraheme cytochrome c subunit
MLPLQLIVALLAGLGVVVLLFLGARSLAGQTVGRIVLLVGLVALPLLLSVGNISYGFHQSSTTAFCLSCHEMKDYG